MKQSQKYFNWLDQFLIQTTQVIHQSDSLDICNISLCVLLWKLVDSGSNMAANTATLPKSYSNVYRNSTHCMKLRPPRACFTNEVL